MSIFNLEKHGQFDLEYFRLESETLHLEKMFSVS